jgi:hypothetical protein
MGSVSFPLRAYDKFAAAAEFRGRSWNWVDPQKEMTAAITGLQAGILSLSDVAANYGKDSEELLSQIARDRKLMDQFGISYGLEPYGVQKMPEAAGQIEDEPSQVANISKPTTQATGEEEASPSAEDQGIQSPDKLMNGAQVASIIEVVKAFGSGIISEQSAIEVLIVGFGLAEDKAKKILGGASKIDADV